MTTRLTRPVHASRLIGLLALLGGMTANAEPVSSTWICANGNFERDIQLLRNTGPLHGPANDSVNAFACRVIYTKNGESEVLWLARNDPDYCEPKLLALIGTLQTAGFQCEGTGAPVSGADRSSASSIDSDSAAQPSAAEPSSPARSSDDAVLRGLLERYYEDFYLDAMIAAIPAGYSVGAAIDSVSTQSGEVLYVGPPNHFVRTMTDGSYVLVNTLVLQRDSTSSFVNLGFVVRDNRYRFLGYAIVGPAVEAKVNEADTREVTLMATMAATASCEGVRRMRTLRWTPGFDANSSQQIAQPTTGPGSESDCGD